jgi:ribonuclease R
MNKENQIKVGDVLEGTISMNASGSCYLTSQDLPKDIYIHNTKTNKALHLDLVKIEILSGKGQRGIEGRVIEILERFKDTFVGTLQVSERYAFLVPDSKKMPIDIFIPLSKLMGGTDGQKAVGQLTNWKDDAKSPNGKIIEVLGDAGDNDVEIHSILHEYDLPYSFDEDVIAESELISEVITDKEISKRKDMCDVLTFTIDPDTAKDFDDALSVEWVDGKMVVGVHIADVSHYLRPDTSLDKEALARGTSVYLVDRVVPMLPERLSNGLCSLRPHEDKLCFSAIFTLDHNGHVLNEWFGRTVIHSDHRFTYEEAQHIIECQHSGDQVSHQKGKPWQIDTDKAGFDGVDKTLVNSLGNAVVALDKTAKKMRAQRFKRGSISFDNQEIKFKLDENNKPVDILFKIQKDSNKLIEEYMLLANRHVATYLKKKGPCVNRAHDRPDPTKLESLKEFIAPLGYQIKTNNPDEITSTLNQLLIDVKGTPLEIMIGNLVVRTMQKANYTTENMGHYGLGFKDYAHFTSPIRRYADVIIHRMLGRALEGKSSMKPSKLEARCKHISEREIKAQKASRDSDKYMQCIYMSERVGKLFKGRISSVQEYGVFVSIDENGCEGLVRLSEIGGDTFTADVLNHCVIGHNTGEKIHLGDEIDIIVKGVDIERKNIDFTLIR